MHRYGLNRCRLPSQQAASVTQQTIEFPHSKSQRVCIYVSNLVSVGGALFFISCERSHRLDYFGEHSHWPDLGRGTAVMLPACLFSDFSRIFSFVFYRTVISYILHALIKHATQRGKRKVSRVLSPVDSAN